MKAQGGHWGTAVQAALPVSGPCRGGGRPSCAPPRVVADTQGRGHGWSRGLEGQQEWDHTGTGTGEALRGLWVPEALLGGAIASEPLITGRTGGWCKYIRGPRYWEGGHNYLRGPCSWEDWEGQLSQRSSLLEGLMEGGQSPQGPLLLGVLGLEGGQLPQRSLSLGRLGAQLPQRPSLLGALGSQLP